MDKETMIRRAMKTIEDQKQVIEYYETKMAKCYDDKVVRTVIAFAKADIEYHENVIELVIEGKMKE